MKPWERYKELKPLTEEQKAKSSGDYSKGVPLAFLTGTLEGVGSGLESYANGYTLGGYDWLNRQFGRNPQDLRDKLQQRAESVGLGGLNTTGQVVSGLGGALRGLPKLTGIAGDKLLGSRAWGLPAMGLSGGADGLVQSSFDNDFSNTGDSVVDALHGGAIATGLGIVGNVALKPLAGYLSSKHLTKGLKGGLNNIADESKALKVVNDAVKRNDDIAQLYLNEVPSGLNQVNADTTTLLNRALTRRIDVPSSIDKQKQKYRNFMEANAGQEVLDFSPRTELLAREELVNQLRNGNFSDITLGSLGKKQLDAINELRTVKGLPLLDEKMYLPENVIRKLAEKRVGLDKMTPEDVGDMVFDILTNPGNATGGSRYAHVQSILNPGDRVSQMGFVAQNPNNGETVLKSAYRKANRDIIRDNPEYKGILEGRTKIFPSSLPASKAAGARFSAQQNPSIFDNIANKNIVVNSKLPHISTLYEGLNPYQREALTDAINQGRKMTNSKLGSLDSINEAKKSLNDMITKSFREGENAKVMHLESIKNRLDNTLGKGLKGRDRPYAKALQMEEAYNKGWEYNPNNVKLKEYTDNLSPLERNAFAQGLFGRMTYNPLMSKNLAKKAMDYDNTLQTVLPKKTYGELQKGLSKQNTRFERLSRLGKRAETRLQTPEGSRLFLREQLEETTPKVLGMPALGALLDEAIYRGHQVAAKNAAKKLLDATFEGVNDAWLIENYPTLNAYISGALANE